MINENEIRRTLSLLKPDGHLFEVRVIYNSKAVYSGYFKSADDLMAALSRDIRDYANCNIYITLNYLNDECYSRSQRNRFMSKGLATTSDDKYKLKKRDQLKRMQRWVNSRYAFMACERFEDYTG